MAGAEPVSMDKVGALACRLAAQSTRQLVGCVATAQHRVITGLRAARIQPMRLTACMQALYTPATHPAHCPSHPCVCVHPLAVHHRPAGGTELVREPEVPAGHAVQLAAVPPRQVAARDAGCEAAAVGDVRCMPAGVVAAAGTAGRAAGAAASAGKVAGAGRTGGAADAAGTSCATGAAGTQDNRSGQLGRAAVAATASRA